jgi:hypothetical protein
MENSSKKLLDYGHANTSSHDTTQIICGNIGKGSFGIPFCQHAHHIHRKSAEGCEAVEIVQMTNVA